MLASASELRLVGESSSGREALKVVKSLRPDVVLMDVHMPELDGPATARALLAEHPDTKVIAWTVSDSSDDLLRMMQAGCSGYVLKEAGPSELQRALLAAMRSENPVPRRMIPEVLKRVAATSPVSQDAKVTLTSREMQILRGIAKGQTTKRLSKDLRISPASVETHLRNIFKKLEVNNRGEAVARALRIGLITLADV